MTWTHWQAENSIKKVWRQRSEEASMWRAQRLNNMSATLEESRLENEVWQFPVRAQDLAFKSEWVRAWGPSWHHKLTTSCSLEGQRLIAAKWESVSVCTWDCGSAAAWLEIFSHPHPWCSPSWSVWWGNAAHLQWAGRATGAASPEMNMMTVRSREGGITRIEGIA